MDRVVIMHDIMLQGTFKFQARHGCCMIVLVTIVVSAGILYTDILIL